MTQRASWNVLRSGTSARWKLELMPFCWSPVCHTLVLATLATYLIRMGQVDRGMDLAEETMRLNPLHPGWLHTSVGLHHYLRGEYRAT